MQSADVTTASWTDLAMRRGTKYGELHVWKYREGTREKKEKSKAEHTCRDGAVGWCAVNRAGSLTTLWRSARCWPQLPQKDSSNTSRTSRTCPPAMAMRDSSFSLLRLA